MPRRMKDNQRRAMFARMQNKNYTQLKHLGIKLPPKQDADGDGVPNAKDCKPLDKRRQGIIHDLIKRKEQFVNDRVKKKEMKLEQKQDELLREIDDEKTTLKKHMKVTRAINDNKKLKEELNSLKQANFAQTKRGKVVVFLRDPETKKTVRKTFKSIKKLFK